MILYLEPVGGIAGDMFLAAALDLGVSLEALERPLRTLGVSGWSFARSTAQRHSLSGTHLDVVVESGADAHVHRALSDIEALIARSQLSEFAKATALRIFGLLGAAEAKVHGVPLSEIHFHEVGAVDSIVDICGAAVALELLGCPQVFSAPPPLGSGTTRVAHGVVPVPVPATLELLRDLPVRFEGVGELTTPTGAALLKAFATLAPPPPMAVERIGYGVGTRDFKDRANVLRASLGRPSAEASGTYEVAVNLDDCSPQVLGALAERLLAQGALDVWISPVLMKKGRPGHLLSFLCDGAGKPALISTVLRESTSLGVREHRVERTMLQRRFETVSTPFGPVRMKLGFEGDSLRNAAPEFEDCRALADAAQVPIKLVLAAAQAAWAAQR